jgi:acetoin utilization protein AcuC
VGRAGIAWGNRDDSFQSRPDGSVSWVFGAAGSSTVVLCTFRDDAVFADGFDSGGLSRWTITDPWTPAAGTVRPAGVRRIVAYNHAVTPADPSTTNRGVAVYHGEELAGYGFGHGHPFGIDRLGAFWAGMVARELVGRVDVVPPVMASREEIESFHAPGYVDRVIRQSIDGKGFLDYGDTPAFPGIYEAATWVVGSTLDAVRRLTTGRGRRAFVPIAGLHHARRDAAGGFCVFNDCGVAIEILRSWWGVRRIAYVDIDAHHGDGVYYDFEDDPDLIVGDIHEDGRFLYPGTGWGHETGSGAAVGTKLNIPVTPGADDARFFEAWERVEAHVEAAAPEFVILQCGADGLADDPLTNLQYSAAAHRHATSRLCLLADRHCAGRILALGGGGYDPKGIADAWCAVVEAMLDTRYPMPDGRG